jgi:hypothetical protein
MIIKTLALMLAVSSIALCADVTGKWKASLQGQNGTMEILYDFKVDGSKLTGTVASPRGETAITEGKVEGNDISFVIATDDFRAVNKGTISGDEIKFKIEAGERTFEVTAKRAESK